MRKLIQTHITPKNSQPVRHANKLNTHPLPQKPPLPHPGATAGNGKKSCNITRRQSKQNPQGQGQLAIAQMQLEQMLREKYSSQQVSCLYSEHIYKSAPRDYLHEAELHKYKALLEAEKAERNKLLMEQSEWNLERARLAEEKQVILFALESLSAKLDDLTAAKKAKSLRRQTSLAVKYKSTKGMKPVQNVIRFSEEGNMEEQEEEVEDEVKGKSKIEIGEGDGARLLQEVKSKLGIKTNEEVKDLIAAYDKCREQLTVCKQSQERQKLRANQLQSSMAKLQEQVIRLTTSAQEKSHKSKLLQEENTKLKAQLTKQQQSNEKLVNEIIGYKQRQNHVQQERQKILKRVNDLEFQLQLTQKQQFQRQQKQKQDVKALQKFSKQLQLNDEKIQQFLNTEVQAYKSQPPSDLQRSAKTYQQHLSYVLHLSKKKESVYESMMEELRERIKEGEFRTRILEKKLNNMVVHQQRLREMVEKESEKDIVYRTILRFGL